MHPNLEPAGLQRALPPVAARSSGRGFVVMTARRAAVKRAGQSGGRRKIGPKFAFPREPLSDVETQLKELLFHP